MYASISVIVTTYNDSEYLDRAIESILRQSLLPKQIIIVNDGSTIGDPLFVINRFLDRNDINIKYLTKNNGGASSARNFGLCHVTEEFVTFLDADDEMLEANLNDKYAVIKNLDNSYFAVYGSGITSKKKSINFIDFDGAPKTSLVGKYRSGVPGGCCYYLFRRSSIKSISGFDEGLINNEDFDFIIRLILCGLRCKGVVGCGILITIRPGSLSRSTNVVGTFNNLMIFLNKASEMKYFECGELYKRKAFAYFYLSRRVFGQSPLLSLRALSWGIVYLLTSCYFKK